MAQFFSGADLKRGVLRKCGEVTDGSSDYDALAMMFINQIYFSILSGGNEFNIDLGEGWEWAKNKTPKILTLKPPYETGSVSLTNGSTAGVFSDAPSVSLKYQFLKASDANNPEYYQIISHNAGDTAFTLDGPYNGLTNSTAGFSVVRTVYKLGTENEILRFISPMRVYKTGVDTPLDFQIYGIDANSFHQNYPMAQIMQTTPSRYYWFMDEAKDIYVRFNNSVDEDTRVEVDFIPQPKMLVDTDASIPLLPRNDRIVLEYGAAALLALDKGDDKAASYSTLAVNKMNAMIKANRKSIGQTNSPNRAAINAREGELRQAQRTRFFLR